MGATRRIGAPITPITNPNQIPGLQARYDATSLTGQTEGGQLTGQWTSTDGEGSPGNLGPPINFRSGSGSTPLYYATTAGKTLNGLPGLWFGGANAIAVSGASGLYTITDAFTEYLVLWPSSTTGTVHATDKWGNSNQGEAVIGFDTGNWMAYAGSELLSGTGVDTNPHVVAVDFSPTVAVIRLDGNVIATGATGTEAISQPGIGGIYDSGSPTFTDFAYTGGIFENLYYSRILNPSEHTQVYQYLKTKWGTP